MTSTGIATAVRRAVDSAVFEWSIDDPRDKGVRECRFVPRALDAVVKLATNTRLHEVVDACEAEMERQVVEIGSIDGARAAVVLRSKVLSSRSRRFSVVLRDGMLVPVPTRQ